VVASLLLVADVGKEHSCIIATVVVVAGTAAAGIAGDYPNTAAVEVDTAAQRVGYTPCSTWEAHR
jgi:hypothetical protein